MTAPTQLTCDYASLVNLLGYHLFGLRPTTTDVITESVVSDAQEADILRCISQGLQFIYSSYRWSFLRPLVSITTKAAYSTGTITVDASGNVTGVGTVFPTYTVTSGGKLYIPSVGTYTVLTYTSGTELVLTGFPAASAFTTASIYSLGFDTYPMPTGVDSLEGKLTFAQGTNWPVKPLEKVPEVAIRKMLSQCNTPSRPEYYSETMNTFDPTIGSSRFVTFFPIPDEEYILTSVGTLRPTMIDSANKYPLGLEVLAPCIAESCLAAAERLIEGKDSTHPDGIHNRALAPLLAMAIQRDKEYGSPETLGIDHGEETEDNGPSPTSSIYWDAGGTAGYI